MALRAAVSHGVPLSGTRGFDLLPDHAKRIPWPVGRESRLKTRLHLSETAPLAECFPMSRHLGILRGTLFLVVGAQEPQQLAP